MPALRGIWQNDRSISIQRQSDFCPNWAARDFVRLHLGNANRPRKRDFARSVSLQRQTYDPFTSTRTQAVPAAAAPTAAPPTTARRVVRRATPATLAGVPGRPTLACALLTVSERPPLGDHPGETMAATARTPVANNACLILISLITSSSASQRARHRSTSAPTLPLTIQAPYKIQTATQTELRLPRHQAHQWGA